MTDEAAPLNYFNYFTEVEDAFVRRRGAHLLVSPMDWALIETWKEMGIPLHIVLRAIESAFDGWDARPHRYRRINSIAYCQQEVESSYAEWRQAQVGAAEGDDAAVPDPAAAFPREQVEAYLERVAADLAVARERAHERDGLAEALARATTRLDEIRASTLAAATLDTEGLERDLTALETMIHAGLLEHAPAGSVDEARAEAKTQLKPYRKQMQKEIYRQTFDKFVARRLRERYGVPRLSLFFME